jgi:hypothetical protein
MGRLALSSENADVSLSPVRDLMVLMSAYGT